MFAALSAGHAANLLEVKSYQQVCHVTGILYKPLEHIYCLVTKHIILGAANFSCVHAAYGIASFTHKSKHNSLIYGRSYAKRNSVRAAWKVRTQVKSAVVLWSRGQHVHGFQTPLVRQILE